MTQQEAINRLSRYQSTTQSVWKSDEEKRRTAKAQGWLLYSRKIAVKTALAMNRQGITKQELALRMGCSPQYVSKLLKGEINLSLDEICNLETALNISILQYQFA